MSNWNRLRSRPFRPLLLQAPHHDQNLLPVPRRHAGRLIFGWGRDNQKAAPEGPAKRVDLQIVNEFRSKLRMAEDLISKLAFSLKEIQGMRKKPKAKKEARKKRAKVVGQIGLAVDPKA